MSCPPRRRVAAILTAILAVPAGAALAATASADLPRYDPGGADGVDGHRCRGRRSPGGPGSGATGGRHRARSGGEVRGNVHAAQQERRGLDRRPLHRAGRGPASAGHAGHAGARFMPKIVGTGSPVIALQTAPGAHHFRLIGIEFLPDAGLFSSGLVRLGSAGRGSSATFPTTSSSTAATSMVTPSWAAGAE